MACNRKDRQRWFQHVSNCKAKSQFMIWNHLKPRFPFSLAPQFGFSNPFSSIPSFDVCPAETKARWRLVPAARICPWAFLPVQLLVGRASAGKVLEKLWRNYIIKRIAKSWEIENSLIRKNDGKPARMMECDGRLNGQWWDQWGEDEAIKRIFDILSGLPNQRFFIHPLARTSPRNVWFLQAAAALQIAMLT